MTHPPFTGLYRESISEGDVKIVWVISVYDFDLI